MTTDICYTYRGVQHFRFSGPHWKKKSCFGPHIKYIATRNHKKISNLSKFTILCWASFMAVLGCMRPMGSGWTPCLQYKNNKNKCVISILQLKILAHSIFLAMIHRGGVPVQVKSI